MHSKTVSCKRLRTGKVVAEQKTREGLLDKARVEQGWKKNFTA